MMTINALAAADSVIIPVQSHYLPAKGMSQLLQTIARVRRQINPKLTIDGVLLTMVDYRTNFAKDISFILRRDFGDKLKVFNAEIPLSIRAAETSAKGRIAIALTLLVLGAGTAAAALTASRQADIGGHGGSQSATFISLPGVVDFEDALY